MIFTILRRLMLAAVGVACAFGASAQTAPGPLPAEITKLMERYASALNSGDADTLVNMYSPRGVFMRDDLPAIVGIPALRASYREIFATLKVELRFTVEEGEQSGDVAWLRASSTGTIKVLATGVERPQSFNVLIVFDREGGTWKIRAYLYAANRPDGSPAK